ncbi:MAG: nitronate monooxygenase, partial [Flaviflexus sp.]|nr:nitronate monooxygenase [Flaviflexus sp.]
DDRFWDKLEAAIELKVPALSFTFGFPPGEVVARLRREGIAVLATVATAADARAAASGGAQALICQGPKAGGHRAMFDQTAPEPGGSLAELIAQVRPLGLPIIAAGGISTREQALAALNAGADAVAAGTLFLCATEAGTNEPYRRALREGTRSTALTRAYSGRLARGLVTEFMTRHANAPACYPCVNAMTKPIRSAATAEGDADRMSLWAGEDYVVAEASAAQLLERLRG